MHACMYAARFELMTQHDVLCIALAAVQCTSTTTTTAAVTTTTTAAAAAVTSTAAAISSSDNNNNSIDSLTIRTILPCQSQCDDNDGNFDSDGNGDGSINGRGVGVLFEVIHHLHERRLRHRRGDEDGADDQNIHTLDQDEELACQIILALLSRGMSAVPALAVGGASGIQQQRQTQRREHLKHNASATTTASGSMTRQQRTTNLNLELLRSNKVYDEAFAKVDPHTHTHTHKLVRVLRTTARTQL